MSKRPQGKTVVHEIAVPLPRQLRTVCIASVDAPLPAWLPAPAASDSIVYREPADAISNQARNEESESIDRLLDTLSEVGHSLRQQQRQRLDEMQQVAVELAVAIASRLVHEKIEAGEYAVDAMVRKVVDQLEPGKAVTIHLHPADLELLEQRRGEDGASFENNTGELRILGDENVSRGDCRAETDDGLVVARIDEQINQIRRHLLDNLGDAEIERRQGPRALRRFPDRRQSA